MRGDRAGSAPRGVGRDTSALRRARARARATGGADDPGGPHRGDRRPGAGVCLRGVADRDDRRAREPQRRPWPGRRPGRCAYERSRRGRVRHLGPRAGGRGGAGRRGWRHRRQPPRTAGRRSRGSRRRGGRGGTDPGGCPALAPPQPGSVRSRAMGVILTATAGLCLWIVLWALNVSGFDAILITIVMVLLAIGIRTVLPFLPG